MIEYIKKMNKERKNLVPWIRKLTDVLGFLSIVTGGVMYVYILEEFGAQYLIELETFSIFLYWLTMIVSILIFFTIGQFVVLGIAASILVALDRKSVV